MSPYEQAARFYEPDFAAFRVYLEAHMFHGRVIATDRLFLMARPVWRTWEDVQMMDVEQADPAGDCWHVWMTAGELSALPCVLPFLEGREWVSFHRRGRLVVMRVERFVGKGEEVC